MAPTIVRRSAFALTIAVAGAGFTIAVAPSAHAAGPALTATFTQTSVWSSGYGADIAIRNSGDTAANGWTVEFDLQAGTTVTSSWSSVRTSSGNHYRFTNVSYNATIAPGASVSFGFNAANLGVPLN